MTLSSLAVESVIIVFDTADTLIRYIMLVRMLRMLRILGGVEKFAIVFQVFLDLLPVFWTLFGALFLIMYDYAQLGIALFGGEIYPASPRLDDSKFAEAVRVQIIRHARTHSVCNSQSCMFLRGTGILISTTSAARWYSSSSC